MVYEMKPLACDPKRLCGLSEKLIVSTNCVVCNHME
jgi:hypothetical protein